MGSTKGLLPSLSVKATKLGIDSATVDSSFVAFSRQGPPSPLSPLATTFHHKSNESDRDFIIHAVVGFERPVDVKKLKETLQERLVKHWRFCSVVRKREGRLEWAHVEVDVEKHVEVHNLRSSRASNPVMKFVNDVMDRPLDPTKPLWEVHILQHKQQGDCGETLLFRIMHSLGDGISLASLLLALTKQASDGGVPQLPRPRQSPPPSCWQLILHFLCMLWNTLLASLRLTATLLLPPDKPSAFKTPVNLRGFSKRAFLFPEALPFSSLKQAAALVPGATVNDVLLTLLSGALQRYEHKRCSGSAELNPPSPLPQEELHQPLHCLHVVNLRPPPSREDILEVLENEDESTKRRRIKSWGNVVGYVVIKLPVFGAKGPVDRLRRAKGVMDRAKLSWEGPLSSVVSRTVHALVGSKGLLAVLMHLISKLTVAISNVPGPREKLHFIDNTIVSVAQFVTGSPLALAVHAQGYAGKLQIVLNHSPELLPDPQALYQCFIDELNELQSTSQTS